MSYRSIRRRLFLGDAEDSASEEIGAPLQVVAYTTDWCPDCVRSKRVLRRAGVEFTEIDIELVTGSEKEMRSLNGDSGKVPTILIERAGKRTVLVEPTDRELADALRACR